MDISNLEREKSIMRCLTKSIPLRIAGLDSASCYDYLLSHPNIEVGKLITVIYYAADQITNPWQKKMIKATMSVGLAVCCRNEKYASVLSKILTQLYGYDVNIEKHKSFNPLEKAMLKILLKTSDKIFKERIHALNMAHDLLFNCSNESISFIHGITSDAMKDGFDEKEYNRTFPLFEFLLYILYLDTAYRDPFFWILDKISRQEMRDAISQHVIKPYDWYVNVWVRSKKLTAEQKARGVIPPYGHSIVERRMVPTKQSLDLKKK